MPARCVDDVHRKSSQEQNNKPRLQTGLGATELLNVQLPCFPTSYDTVYLCFHLGFCKICFARATARSVVSATNLMREHGANFIFLNEISLTWCHLFFTD